MSSSGYRPSKPLALADMQEIYAELSPAAQAEIDAVVVHAVEVIHHQFGPGSGLELIGALVRWHFSAKCARCGLRRNRLPSGRYYCPNCD